MENMTCGIQIGTYGIAGYGPKSAFTDEGTPGPFFWINNLYTGLKLWTDCETIILFLSNNPSNIASSSSVEPSSQVTLKVIEKHGLRKDDLLG
jgi:hypothetical protein